jgi:hypothetical protein
MNRRRLGEWIMSRSAKPHNRNRVDATVSGSERKTPAADEQRASRTRFDPHLLMHETRSQTSRR